MKDPGSYANPINSSFQKFRTTSVSSILRYKRRGTFIDSCSRSDGIKVPCCTQRCRLTRAMASAKEGLVLSYHAAVRGAMPPRCSIRISAASVTTLNRPKSAGVVRAMARFRPLALGFHAQVSP